MRILDHLLIILVTEIFNRQPDILHLRLIGLTGSGRIRIVRAPGGGFEGEPSRGSAAATGVPPHHPLGYPEHTVLAIDCAVTATGPQLFVGQIVAEIGLGCGGGEWR